MANLIIYQKKTDIIHAFIQDCIKDGNNFIGSNIKLIGIKPELFDYKWTNEIIDIKIDSPKVSEVTEAEIEDQVEIKRPNKTDYQAALKIRKLIEDMDYTQIETYIDNNVIDLASAKNVLKIYGKVILALCRQIDFKE